MFPLNEDNSIGIDVVRQWKIKYILELFKKVSDYEKQDQNCIFKYVNLLYDINSVAFYMFLPLIMTSFSEHLPEVDHNGRQKHVGDCCLYCNKFTYFNINILSLFLIINHHFMGTNHLKFN
jgi:hypothetical protein